MEYRENDFTDALIEYFENIENIRHMENIEFLKELKSIIICYLDPNSSKVDIFTGELLTEEDFILLLNKILSNYVKRNFNRT